jgi:hypothetical protein
MADRVIELADEATAAGQFLSAAEKYGRATALLRDRGAHAEPSLRSPQEGLSHLTENHGSDDFCGITQLRARRDIIRRR